MSSNADAKPLDERLAAFEVCARAVAALGTRRDQQRVIDAVCTLLGLQVVPADERIDDDG